MSAPSRTATWLRTLALASALLGCAACVGTPVDQKVAELRELLALPPHLQLPVIPTQNPLTKPKIALGRRLFYDKQLSGNQTQACATCHLQKFAFSNGEKTATGSMGHVLRRNSPGLANVAYSATLSWANNGLLDLESLLPVPIRNDNPPELGINDANQETVLARFDADPTYRALFRDAFPDSPSGATMNKIIFALASFCRTLISGNSPFDRYMAGDIASLNESQRRGLGLFNGEKFECFHCHKGTHLSVSYVDANTPLGSISYPFFNNGLYNVDGKGSYPASDQGLYDVTMNLDHRGLFRPPSLRNVALTAPYMHDGSVATPREVVMHYAAGGRVIPSGPNAGDGRTSPLKSGLVRSFDATEQEIDDMVAFLESLTDPWFVSNPAFSDPAAM